MSRDMGRGVLVAALAASLLLNVAALGWVSWIVAEPAYWFPNAFAEKGEQGDQGRRGQRGPRGAVGPPGPVGPSVEEVVSDLDSRIEQLELGLSTTELQGQVDDLASQVEDVSSQVDDVAGEAQAVVDRVENICSQLLQSDIEALNDLYYYGC